MNTIKDGGPAFPMQDPQAIHAWAQAKIETLGLATTAERDAAYIQARAEAVGGMSLRDYFAAKAMHQLLAGAVLPKGYDASDDFASLAARAYEIADAMIRAREVTA